MKKKLTAALALALSLLFAPAALAAEELLTDRPDGVVIARCADGDRVLLLVDGTVIRFSHESPESVNRWPGLSQFMADAVADGE